jgi:DnaJ-domain-containing protein 1
MYLTDATILSEEGSREVLEEMARPPEDTPQRRRAFALARFATELWRRQEAVEEATRPNGCKAD